jgi:hypothetical protein
MLAPSLLYLYLCSLSESWSDFSSRQKAGHSIYNILNVLFYFVSEIGESPHTVLFTANELKSLAPFYGSARDTCFDGLHKALKDHSWLKIMDLIQVLKQPLMRLCIRYLYIEKRRGYALNPVGR